MGRHKCLIGHRAELSGFENWCFWNFYYVIAWFPKIIEWSSQQAEIFQFRLSFNGLCLPSLRPHQPHWVAFDSISDWKMKIISYFWWQMQWKSTNSSGPFMYLLKVKKSSDTLIEWYLKETFQANLLIFELPWHCCHNKYVNCRHRLLINEMKWKWLSLIF